MKKTNEKLSYEKIFLDIIVTSSNLNHSCPFEVSQNVWEKWFWLIDFIYLFFFLQNAIIVKDLIIQADFFKFMPLPTGQYKFQLIAATDKQWKTIVKTFFTFSEEQLKIWKYVYEIYMITKNDLLLVVVYCIELLSTQNQNFSWKYFMDIKLFNLSAHKSRQ